jgi:hypothetical protein
MCMYYGHYGKQDPYTLMTASQSTFIYFHRAFEKAEIIIPHLKDSGDSWAQAGEHWGASGRGSWGAAGRRNDRRRRRATGTVLGGKANVGVGARSGQGRLEVADTGVVATNVCESNTASESVTERNAGGERRSSRVGEITTSTVGLAGDGVACWWVGGKSSARAGGDWRGGRGH